MRILVTGANGWIAQALCDALVQMGHMVTGLTRQSSWTRTGATAWVHAEDDFTGIDSAWAHRTFDVVVHLAGRVHVMQETSTDPTRAYQEANVEATERLAQAARAHGVRRFVFLSSIKALGDTEPGRPWREDDTPAVQDAYGRSKWDAERRLLALHGDAFEVSILRIPLAYGPGVGANFARLMNWVAAGRPLPLARAHAPRSMIARDNVVSALQACIDQPGASGRILHATDRTDLGVAELILAMALALEVAPRLIAVPLSILRAAAQISGKGEIIHRLIEPLRLDSERSRELLHWQAPVVMATALEETARAWRRASA